jgi:Helix-turn-helix domain
MARTIWTLLSIFVIAPLGALAFDTPLSGNWIWHIDPDKAREPPAKIKADRVPDEFMEALVVDTGQIRQGYRTQAEKSGLTYDAVRQRALADGSHKLKVNKSDGAVCPGNNAGRFDRAEQVRALRAEGCSIREIAARLGVSTSTVWLDTHDDHGKAFRRARRRRSKGVI